MADETELTITRKLRGRYREYMRHSNPYKFPAARRRKGNFQKAKQSPAVTRNGFNKCESDVQEVFCEQPRELGRSIFNPTPPPLWMSGFLPVDLDE